MAFTAKDVIHSASIILQDAGATRWPLTELLRWTNMGIREIVRLKPNATAETAELELAEGPYQTLPDDVYLLVRAVRNLTSAKDAAVRVGGASIRVVTREIIDAAIPSWQDPTVLPYATLVNHVIQDMADPRVYYVVPGNDGDGLIEAVVSKMPAKLAEPADPLTISSYAEMTIALPDEYEAPLIDYVLYRSMSKDMALAGSSKRATMHYQAFAQALGASLGVEQVANVNTTNSQPDS